MSLSKSEDDALKSILTTGLVLLLVEIDRTIWILSYFFLTAYKKRLQLIFFSVQNYCFKVQRKCIKSGKIGVKPYLAYDF